MSYPTYLRLQRLREVAEQLDADMSRLASQHPIEDLETFPEWNKLVAVREAMFHVLVPAGEQKE